MTEKNLVVTSEKQQIQAFFEPRRLCLAFSEEGEEKSLASIRARRKEPAKCPNLRKLKKSFQKGARGEKTPNDFAKRQCVLQ